MASEGQQREKIRLVMIGKTGAGKSSLGNSLLRRSEFKVGRGINSETKFCDYGVGALDDIEFQVVDTPGLCDTHTEEEVIYRELGKSVALADPGPHVILMVLRCDRRFTAEEFAAYETLKKLFGEEMCKHLVVVFNGLDSLDTDESGELDVMRSNLEVELQKAPEELKNLLKEPKGGYISINNRERCEETKHLMLQDLVGTIRRVVSENGHSYYTNDVSAEIHKLVQEMALKRMRKKQGKTKAQKPYVSTSSGDQTVVISSTTTEMGAEQETVSEMPEEVIDEVKEDINSGKEDPSGFTARVRALFAKIKESVSNLCPVQ